MFGTIINQPHTGSSKTQNAKNPVYFRIETENESAIWPIILDLSEAGKQRTFSRNLSSVLLHSNQHSLSKQFKSFT